jgi:hypothetical protein
VSRPPSGIASRALIARFKIASSSWLASATAGRAAGSGSRRNSISGPTVRASNSSVPRSAAFTSITPRASFWVREKAKSWAVRLGAAHGRLECCTGELQRPFVACHAELQ